MASLLGVSLFASLIAILIPQNLIGLFGLLPIAIGIKELIEVRNAASEDINNDKVVKRLSKSRWKTHLPFLVVTLVTFSGGEEIGVYTSIFVTYDGLWEIIIIVWTVMILTGVWCVIGFYLVNHTRLAPRLRRIADRLARIDAISLPKL